MLKHITLGTKEVFYYNYNGESLPLRPISSFELDQCFYNSLVFAEEEVSELVVKLKLSLIDPKSKIDINNKKYADLKKFYDLIDYWIVYYSMKDFQDEDFSKPKNGIPSGFLLVKKMNDIHKIAKTILHSSYQPKEVIEEIIKDGSGKLIAKIVFNLNVPLAEFSKITKLQRDFLVLSKIDLEKPIPHIISKTGDKVSFRDVLRGMV